MTTNELKSYIDRILGNNIRLLLPSYWWKRAFGAVIDKVESVEASAASASRIAYSKQNKLVSGTNIKTVNGESILGEGDLKVETGSEAISFILRVDGDFNLVQNEEDKSHNKLSYQQYAKDMTKGTYRNIEVHCLIGGNDKYITPNSLSWEAAGIAAYLGVNSTPWVVFSNVCLYATMLRKDVFFTESGEVALFNHVNKLGAEFLYYRPQYQDTMKAHNASVFEQMNKSFLNLFFVEQNVKDNGKEIANATSSCVYIKSDDHFLIYVPSTTSVSIYKLTSDGLITSAGVSSQIDEQLSTTSTRSVQNKVVTAALNEKADKEYVDNAFAQDHVLMEFNIEDDMNLTVTYVGMGDGSDFHIDENGYLTLK